MMANPVNVSTASRAALRASRLFSAEEIDAILDLRSSSGVLNWRFLCGVGSINQDRWMRLLRQNAICGQFEEDEGDEDAGQQRDDDAHLGAVGGTGVLNRESEEWPDRMQRMEERLDRMEGTAQEHERLLVAHSVSIDAQRNRLSDVIEVLAESEVGDRNRMMDLLRRQCGMTSSDASPVANRQQNVLDWSMQHATWVDELSSASDASFRECSPQGQDTIPLVVGGTARDGQSMGPWSYEDQGMFRGQPGTLGPQNNSPRPVNMPATVPQSELHSTQPFRDSHVALRGLRQNAPQIYGSPQSIHLKVGYPFTVDSTQWVTHGREDSYAPLQNTFLLPTSVSIPQTPVYHPFTSFFLSATSTHSKWELMLYCLHCPTLNKVFLLLLLLLHLVPDFSHGIIKETPHHCIISCHTHSPMVIGWHGQEMLHNNPFNLIVSLRMVLSMRRKWCSLMRGLQRCTTGRQILGCPQAVQKVLHQSRGESTGASWDSRLILGMNPVNLQVAGKRIVSRRWDTRKRREVDVSLEGRGMKTLTAAVRIVVPTVTERRPAGWVTVAPHFPNCKPLMAGLRTGSLSSSSLRTWLAAVDRVR